jgi:hypothetical protein
MSDDPTAAVRADEGGGWISGACAPVPPVPPVPPGSTPLRELLRAIVGTLSLPGPATQRDETTYLRLHRDRARLVLFAARRLLADREADDVDIMIAVDRLRGETMQHPADTYDPHPLSS